MKKGDETDRGVVDAVKTALSVGYRHLDGAQSKSAHTPSLPPLTQNLGSTAELN